MNRVAICTITRGEILFGLEHLDLDATRPEQVEAIENADLWLNDEARNHAIRINRQTFEPEVVQQWFSSARNAWNQIKLSRRGSAVGRCRSVYAHPDGNV